MNTGKAGGSKSETAIVKHLDTNLAYITDKLGKEQDIVIREFEILTSSRVAMAFISGITDNNAINTLVMSMLKETQMTESPASTEDAYHFLMYRSLAVGSITKFDNMEDVLQSMLEGSTVLLLEGHEAAIAAATAGLERRGVEEPSTQTVIRGPKEGFSENITTNMALIRNIIKSADLRIEYIILGRQTRTTVALAYMQNIADDKVVNEMRQKLKGIKIDSILDSGYIEEFIQGKKYSPFPLLENTERPDAVSAGLLEGQVAIIVDGTPFALLSPVTFIKFFQSSEDYYQRYDIATFLRFIRFGSFFVSMLLPSLYIAVTTFHQEMLPTPLLISIAAQREGVPFPALIEAFLMEITFEVLREAGVRMPRIIGPAISIVGALVLGQAAVQAGLVSAAMVIVVSFTAIASFVIPSESMGTAGRLIRFMLMILGGSFGFFGIMAGLMILLAHVSGLQSFGVPYMSPLSPLRINGLKDVFIRVPWWAMNRRPGLYDRQGTKREATDMTAAEQSRGKKEGGGNE